MELILFEKRDAKIWDDFCARSKGAWFWHTSKWLNYTLDYRPDSKPVSKSFFIKQDNKIIAVCPLIIENNEEAREFAFGNNFGPLPVFADDLSDKTAEKAKKFAFESVDRIAKENAVARARFRFSVLDDTSLKAKTPLNNYLLKFGYIDCSLNSRLVDLGRSISELKKDLRHGHDYDIDRAAKFFTAEIFDRDNITLEMFENYVNLHHKAAGRITRPRSTFDVMFDIIKDGNGFLVGVKKGESFAGISYFFQYKNNVYYGSSCNDPEYGDLPVAHLIQWRAIEYMKKSGFEFYEIGWQHYGNTLANFPSAKELDIARFKRGFGGFTVPLFMGEKYYNKDCFLNIYQDRIIKYAQNI